jgi:hypothetical protein
MQTSIYRKALQYCERLHDIEVLKTREGMGNTNRGGFKKI